MPAPQPAVLSRRRSLILLFSPPQDAGEGASSPHPEPPTGLNVQRLAVSSHHTCDERKWREIKKRGARVTLKPPRSQENGLAVPAPAGVASMESRRSSGAARS